MTYDIIHVLEWVFLIYFISLNSGYIFLNLISVLQISRYISITNSKALPIAMGGMEPPVTIIVPAYNEESGITTSVLAMLQLHYPNFEILVVNDGSSDNTLETLVSDFKMKLFPEAYRQRLKTQKVNAVYQSTRYPNLRLVDKVNGGKADAINCGINIARYPLFCVVDADSILQQDSLQQVVQPFLEDNRTIAAGGTIRIVNGCEAQNGFLRKVDLPRNPLVLIQIVEYLRAFLFGRIGWAPLNALLIISGAFGVFKKEAVIMAGGYRHDTVGEDMELVVRLHRIMRQSGRPYRITYVPDPVCWTEAPEHLKDLRSQRVRWQRGLMESLWKNLSLLFHYRGGTVGWIAFPYMVFFEMLGPFIEVIGYLFFLFGLIFGYLSNEAAIIFFLASMCYGMLLSSVALMLEELSFRIYPKTRHTFILLFIVLLENFGYRQINSFWRFQGMLSWLFQQKGKWGEIQRKGISSKGKK